MSTGKKWAPAVIALVVVGYTADAVYPTWDWQCTAQGALHAMPSIPEVSDDPQTGGPFRHLSMTRPKGCTATPHNLLRAVVDRLVG